MTAESVETTSLKPTASILLHEPRPYTQDNHRHAIVEPPGPIVHMQSAAASAMLAGRPEPGADPADAVLLHRPATSPLPPRAGLAAPARRIPLPPNAGADGPAAGAGAAAAAWEWEAGAMGGCAGGDDPFRGDWGRWP
jgi:hypothetical protein